MVRIERFGDVTTPAPPADPAASSTEPGGESDSTVIWVVGGATVLALAALFGTWGDG